MISQNRSEAQKSINNRTMAGLRMPAVFCTCRIGHGNGPGPRSVAECGPMTLCLQGWHLLFCCFGARSWSLSLLPMSLRQRGPPSGLRDGSPGF